MIIEKRQTGRGMKGDKKRDRGMKGDKKRDISRQEERERKRQCIWVQKGNRNYLQPALILIIALNVKENRTE